MHDLASSREHRDRPCMDADNRVFSIPHGPLRSSHLSGKRSTRRDCGGVAPCRPSPVCVTDPAPGELASFVAATIEPIGRKPFCDMNLVMVSRLGSFVCELRSSSGRSLSPTGPKGHRPFSIPTTEMSKSTRSGQTAPLDLCTTSGKRQLAERTIRTPESCRRVTRLDPPE